MTKKLPRGSFYYIKVGHRFYSGLDLHTQEVKESIVDPRQYSRDTKYYWPPLTLYARNNAKKIKPPKMKLTGRFSIRLVDDEDNAKKFRRKSQVETACSKLERYYNGICKPTIHLKEN